MVSNLQCIFARNFYLNYSTPKQNSLQKFGSKQHWNPPKNIQDREPSVSHFFSLIFFSLTLRLLAVLIQSIVVTNPKQIFPQKFYHIFSTYWTYFTQKFSTKQSLDKVQ